MYYTSFLSILPLWMLSLPILSFLRACFNTYDDKAASMSATLDPWFTFKQASLNGGRIKMDSRMLHLI